MTMIAPQGNLRPWFQLNGFTRVRGTDRFWRQVGVTLDAAACWPWRGGRSGCGYGVLRWRGAVVYAHRLAFELSRGYAPPEERVVRHLCGNPLCCRPSHLELGTKKDNSADMVAMGRQRNCRTLTPEDVRAIREMEGQRTVDTCAHYGISQKALWKVQAGRTYAEVET